MILPGRCTFLVSRFLGHVCTKDDMFKSNLIVFVDAAVQDLEESISFWPSLLIEDEYGLSLSFEIPMLAMYH
jgi:hypothetical protein